LFLCHDCRLFSFFLLFYLTYILCHIFNNFTNYYWLWFLICTERLKSARNGWTILSLCFAAIALFQYIAI
jgi:hypothetical protein